MRSTLKQYAAPKKLKPLNKDLDVSLMSSIEINDSITLPEN
jgi:hypothetical protein